MAIQDFYCPQCNFIEERFIRGKQSEYDPGVCPNGCSIVIEADGRKQQLQQRVPQPLEMKFNAGAMAPPIFRGYGWHCTDYGPNSAK